MSYIHTGKGPVTLAKDPADPHGTDWVFFSYQNWLRPNESITTHHALITGGAIITDSTYLGPMTDNEGTSYEECYGIEFSVLAGATEVAITHRISTTTTGLIDLGRTNMDRTAILRVQNL